MIDYVIFLLFAYLIGSIPFGLIAGKFVKNVDIRNHGSGKTGMTNVQRTVGTPAAVLVLVLDMGKAIVAVIIARIFFNSSGLEAIAALAVMFGHNWPVFVRFRGGRGTASGWGGLFILSPVAGIVATIAGLPVIALTRYVSLGSISATIAGSITLMVLVGLGFVPLAYTWFAVIGSLVVLTRHSDNIKRLINGTERKLGRQVKTCA